MKHIHKSIHTYKHETYANMHTRMWEANICRRAKDSDWRRRARLQHFSARSFRRDEATNLHYRSETRVATEVQPITRAALVLC